MQENPLATQFVAAGLAAGEPAVIAVFEEHPREFLAHAKNRVPDLTQWLTRACWR